MINQALNELDQLKKLKLLSVAKLHVKDSFRLNAMHLPSNDSFVKNNSDNLRKDIFKLYPIK